MRASFVALAAAILVACAPEPVIDRARVERVVSALAADSMLGRRAFTPAADRAAAFINREFADIGLETLDGLNGYLQTFSVDAVAPPGPDQMNGRPALAANVVGVISGRRRHEMVLFSAHYDHVGVGQGVDGDSVFNGANDNASGTTAVIELARYFKAKGRPERTLVFAAFTAEEAGGFGSRYFSQQLDPGRIVAMFNIEMIGKPSAQGPNHAWITGFERSSLGTILQEAVAGTEFAFDPDPYPQENLFYRSDNATLARLGVPAHSFSTTPIDVDHDYHQVSDEVGTLDLDHMTNTIRAIARGAAPIIAGSATPTRVDSTQARRPLP